MPNAVICPVCGGSGKVTPPSFGWSSGYTTSTGYGSQLVTCHGCYGKGWVEVGK